MTSVASMRDASTLAPACIDGGTALARIGRIALALRMRPIVATWAGAAGGARWARQGAVAVAGPTRALALVVRFMLRGGGGGCGSARTNEIRGCQPPPQLCYGPFSALAARRGRKSPFQWGRERAA